MEEDEEIIIDFTSESNFKSQLRIKYHSCRPEFESNHTQKYQAWWFTIGTQEFSAEGDSIPGAHRPGFLVQSMLVEDIVLWNKVGPLYKEMNCLPHTCAICSHAPLPHVNTPLYIGTCLHNYNNLETEIIVLNYLMTDLIVHTYR